MSSERTPSSLERALARLGRVTHRHPWAIVLVLLASMVPAGWLASGLSIRSSFLDLLPADRPAVRQLHDVLDRAQVTSNVLVAIDNEDPEAARRFAQAMAARLASEPLVRAVDARFDVEFFEQRQLLFVEETELRSLIDRAEAAIDDEVMRESGFDLGLDEDEAEEDVASPTELLEEAARRAPSLQSWAVTRDGRWLCMWVVFSGASGDLDFAREAHAVVARAQDDVRRDGAFGGDLEVRLVGGIEQRLDDHERIVGDLALAGPIGFLAVVLLIVGSLRSPRALALLAVPLFVGLVWTFAFARVAVGSLNIISGFLFSILSGLGIEYGIHLHHRFVEMRREGLTLEQATERLLGTTGRALVAIGITNASVFLVSALADFSGFNEFGRIAAAGMILTLIATLLGFPALNVISERWRPTPIPPEDQREVRAIVVPPAVRRGILAVVPAFAIASLVVIATGGVRFEGNWRVLQGDSETTRFDEYVREQLEGTFTNAVIWVRDRREAAVVVDAVRDLGAARPADRWDVAEIRGLDDVVPPAEAQRARAALAGELRGQLERVRPERLDERGRERLAEALRLTHVEPFTVDDVPESFVRAFRTIGDDGTLLVVRTARTYRETDEIVGWAEQVRAISDELARRGLTVSILSENWIAGEIFTTIFADGPFLLIGTLLVVFVVLLFDLRGFRAAAVVLGSVMIGLAGLGGAMAISGVDLNFMNAGILPICVGISLDNALHIYHRYRAEGRDAIPVVLRRTSSANLLSSMTNLVGFGALALARHEGLRSVAFLAVLGVALTYVSTSVFFPLALQVFGRIDRPSGEPLVD
ncbi:efflux RND transporter permease subunit [Sandaracinus amylolyticus]|uniref:efflux RND transporter permease subunit n=1 Tax=Sandaracinus amylolyticus TaxID=927083 RepID=UPI001F01EC5A|nr:MMPL family transporter [Sandaracinus amylolyticus]